MTGKHCNTSGFAVQTVHLFGVLPGLCDIEGYNTAMMVPSAGMWVLQCMMHCLSHCAVSALSANSHECKMHAPVTAQHTKQLPWQNST